MRACRPEVVAWRKSIEGARLLTRDHKGHGPRHHCRRPDDFGQKAVGQMAYERYRLLVGREVPEHGCDGEPTGHMPTARAGDVLEAVPDPLCAARTRMLDVVDGWGDVFWMTVSLDALREMFGELECQPRPPWRRCWRPWGRCAGRRWARLGGAGDGRRRAAPLRAVYIPRRRMGARRRRDALRRAVHNWRGGHGKVDA